MSRILFGSLRSCSDFVSEKSKDTQKPGLHAKQIGIEQPFNQE
jgi:hypothetical protein